MKPIVYLILLILTGFPPSVLCQDLEDTFQHRRLREEMVREQLQSRGISDTRVLSAMGVVPRHLFVPKSLQRRAYGDHPLPIGEGQTISQPYIVALMTDQLKLSKKSRVLEIGTGSGYQAAILSEIVDSVYTIEIKKKLHQRATKTFQRLGFSGIHTRHGDGYFGWKTAQPFDAIMITAAVNHIPPPLLAQLKNGGRLILPLGNPFSYQNLVLATKSGDGFKIKQITGVLFVPMTGRAMNSE